MSHLPSLNGRTKKSLAHQLDRLESLLEGFGPLLQTAITDAVQAAVDAAVRTAATHFEAAAPTAPFANNPPAQEVPVPIRAEYRFRRWLQSAIDGLRHACGTTAAKVVLAIATGRDRIQAAGQRGHAAVRSLTGGFACAVGFGIRSVLALVRGEPRAAGWGIAAAAATIFLLEVVDRLVLTVFASLALGAAVAAFVALPGWLRAIATSRSAPRSDSIL